MQLYKWQKGCLQAWEKNGYRGIVNVVTGAGKTVLALAALDLLKSRYPNLQVKVVVPTISLARQWKESLLHAAATEEWRPGFYGGGVHDDPSRRVMIYVVNSARDSLSGHMRRDFSLGQHVLLICDECHHYQSAENRKIFSFLRDIGEREELYHSIGLSATPFGNQNDSVLIRSLGREIYRYDYNDAAADGVISPFTVCEVSASFLPEERKKYAELTETVRLLLARLYQVYPRLQGLSESIFLRAVSKIANDAGMDSSNPAAAFLLATYQRKEVSNLADARIHCALSIIEKLKHTDRVLVFCERIEQAARMKFCLQRRFGSCCGIYHSGMTKEARSRVMEEFRTNQFRILVSCRCLDEGIDIPEANVAVVLSSSSVSRQRIQRLGRVIRRSDHKDAACLYYIYIRESADDAAYLYGLENCESFSLRYYTSEDIFSNDFYEYVAALLMKKAKNASLPPEQIVEIQKCIAQGLISADPLLSDSVQKRNQSEAGTTHERNYWAVMRKMGRELRKR